MGWYKAGVELICYRDEQNSLGPDGLPVNLRPYFRPTAVRIAYLHEARQWDGHYRSSAAEWLEHWTQEFKPSCSGPCYVVSLRTYFGCDGDSCSEHFGDDGYSLSWSAAPVPQPADQAPPRADQAPQPAPAPPISTEPAATTFSAGGDAWISLLVTGS